MSIEPVSVPPGWRRTASYIGWDRAAGLVVVMVGPDGQGGTYRHTTGWSVDGGPGMPSEQACIDLITGGRS